jgi:nicotinamidase-related amidase
MLRAYRAPFSGAIFPREFSGTERAAADTILSMARHNNDLHGSVPENSAAALLLIDLISDFDFPDGERLAANAEATALAVADLKTRARAAGIPAIYVNDNFGRWTSDFRRLVEHCLKDGVRGQRIARMLSPADDDYFVLKPKHSGFFSTTLELLLRYLHADTLIIAGVTTDVCVTFTANDAYMREYRLWIPADCCAAVEPRDHEYALKYMARVLDADIAPSTAIDLNALRNPAGEARKPGQGPGSGS